VQPGDPNPHLGTQPKENATPPTPTPMDSIQIDLSQLTPEDVEQAFPKLDLDQEQRLRMAIANIQLGIQSNWDIARQTAVLLAGAQSIARLIGFVLKP
jgi:hypothetical protein